MYDKQSSRENRPRYQSLANSMLMGFVDSLGSGRGLFASEDILEGELLLEINSESLINANTHPLANHYSLEYLPPHWPHYQDLFLTLWIVCGRITLSINN